MKPAETVLTKILLLVENHWMATDDVRLLKTLGRHIRDEDSRADIAPPGSTIIRDVRTYRPKHVGRVTLTTRYHR